MQTDIKSYFKLLLGVILVGAGAWYFINLDREREFEEAEKNRPDLISDVEPIEGRSEQAEQTEEDNREKKLQPVQLQFPDDIEAEEDDYRCVPNSFPDGNAPPPLIISKAKDLGQCKQLHHSISTATPREAIQSILKAYENDKAFAKKGDSHSYEIDSLTQAYSFLISAQEFSELDDLEERNTDEGRIAKTILKFHREASNKR